MVRRDVVPVIFLVHATAGRALTLHAVGSVRTKLGTLLNTLDPKSVSTRVLYMRGRWGPDDSKFELHIMHSLELLWLKQKKEH